jgi:hypothetical protein
MSVISNGKVYEGNERPPAGEPDILVPKYECPVCHKWFTLAEHRCIEGAQAFLGETIK